ncbi:MAG TPA: HD domain-containing protein, partial [Chitinophagales bacterium]|nr:HD domain-containing protein [Chitinophagales bacterium]
MESPQVIDVDNDKKVILKEYRALLRALRKNVSHQEKKLIRRAFELAADSHKDMRRKSGEPYVLHPLAVAKIVSGEMGLDATSVICALLHDVVEDTEVTLDEIERTFNKEIAKIVDGLTKISGVFDLNSSLQAENFRKLLLTLNDDIRVILIKLADRLHNMRTLGFIKNPDKRERISRETLDIYAPLARSIGCHRICSELEELAFEHLNPTARDAIVKRLERLRQSQGKAVAVVSGEISARLEAAGVPARVYGREKQPYSIWRKLQRKSVGF